MSALLGRARCFFSSRRPTPRRRPVGSFGSQPACERLEDRALLAAGSLLWATATDFRPTLNDDFADVAVQANGKIVAVGFVQTHDGPGVDDEDFLVARFTADGRLDASFGGSGTGWRTIDFGFDSDDRARSVVIQADGKIVAAGLRDVPVPSMGGLSQFALVRLNRDGSLDSSFGGGDGMVTTFGSGNFAISSVALTSTGGIVAAGNGLFALGGQYGVVARYLSNGELDDSFDQDGTLLVEDRRFNGVALDSSNRIVVAGQDKVSRLTTAGDFDDSFGVDGTKTITFDVGTNVALNDVTLDAQGRIVVAGESAVGYRQAGAARLLAADGEYDNSFDGNGRVSIDLAANAHDSFTDVAALPTGGLVFMGLSDGTTRFWSLTVLTAAGVLDTGFDGDGKRFYYPSVASTPGGLAVGRSGQYVMVGEIGTGADFGSVILAFEGRFPRRDDLAGWANNGQWWVAASNGSSFQTTSYGFWNPNLGWKVVAANDFNGDGLADMAGRDAAGRWWVGLNTGSSFTTSLWSVWNEAAGWRDVRYNDFDGDGRADVAGRASNGQWWVMRSTGTAFATATIWAGWTESAGWLNVTTADYNGDGRTDIAGRALNGDWWVAVSTGTTFATTFWGNWNPASGWQNVLAGDFDGDGRLDLAGQASDGLFWYSRSTGVAFVTGLLTTYNASNWQNALVGDFNGDGRAEIAGRDSTGAWVVISINLAHSAGIWDESKGWRDLRVGDFDGDGRDDIAARTSTGQWWVSRGGSSTFTQSLWGAWSEAAGWQTFREDFRATTT